MARTLSRRSRNKPTLRQVGAGAVRLAAIAIAFVVTVQVSVAGEFRSTAPNAALSVYPFDAEARARLAASLASSNPEADGREAARKLAIDAIRRDALNPGAVRALGLIAEANAAPGGSQAQPLALFTQSERLSRRDLMTQLWLVSYYLQREDIGAVMRHFDVALRTSTSGRELLFPVLGGAAQDRRVADELVTRIKRKPEWALPLANYLLDPQVPPATAAYIINRSLDPKVPDELAVIEALMHRFAVTGEYRLALEVFDHFDLDRENPRGLLNDGGFESTTAAEPFGWTLAEEPELWAAREPRAEGSGVALSLFAEGGRSGPMARQLMTLAPGAYRLTAELGNVPQDAFLRPQVSVECAEGERAPLVAARPTFAGRRGTPMNAGFTVPANCAFQWLTVSLAGPERPVTESPWIDDIRVARVGG